MHGIDNLQDVDEAIGSELNNSRIHSGVSDIFDGLTNATIQGCGYHPLWYWENRKNITSEAFAHMFEAQFDKERYEQMKKYFPLALEYFERKIKELI